MSTTADPIASGDPVRHLEQLARLIRYHILTATTQAGSGHPSSSLSAVELMTGLIFGGAFRYDLNRPQHPNNDRLIFSKGHASPLFYALWAVAGKLTEQDLRSYRRFGSTLEGHPTPRLDLVEAATGSLGQGLSIGGGMALNARYLDHLPYRTYVLLGDSEMTEGSQWEALEIAAAYRLDNLVGVLDVNRFGQRGPTLHGHELAAYERRVAAFGWETMLIDGHALPEVLEAFKRAATMRERPVMIIARTLKGKGVPELEDHDDWHGKTLDAGQLQRALAALGDVDRAARGNIALPEDRRPDPVLPSTTLEPVRYDLAKPVATRAAYGRALARLYPRFPAIVCLDAEVSNSTRADLFKAAHPGRFFEMYIAEQNMVGFALGLARRGKIPFVSTFGAFLSRAFDQVRMAAYSEANLKFVGSHAGVSIGEDGPSQMALEDIAMFRSILGSVVLHPCDAVSTERLVEAAAQHQGLVYLRTLRQETPVIYDPEEPFPIGGSKLLRRTDDDFVTLVGTGATVHECLAAHEILAQEGLPVRVIDAYSLKPMDRPELQQAALETGWILTVEDHYPEGGLGEAVLSALADVPVAVSVLAVRRRPKSGRPHELRAFEGISAATIVERIRELQHANSPLARP